MIGVLVRAQRVHMALICIHQHKGPEHLLAHRPMANIKAHTGDRINSNRMANNMAHHIRRNSMVIPKTKRRHNNNRIHSKVSGVHNCRCTSSACKYHSILFIVVPSDEGKGVRNVPIFFEGSKVPVNRSTETVAQQTPPMPCPAQQQQQQPPPNASPLQTKPRPEPLKKESFQSTQPIPAPAPSTSTTDQQTHSGN